MSQPVDKKTEDKRIRPDELLDISPANPVPGGSIDPDEEIFLDTEDSASDQYEDDFDAALDD